MEEEPPEPEEVVAVVHPNSTVTAPHITFGRVIKTDSDMALISTCEELERNTFVFKVGAGSKARAKLADVVAALDMVYTSATNKYCLRTRKTAIHLIKYPLV